MKIFTRDGRITDAGAYVLMARRHTGHVEPVAAHTTLEGINAAISKLYEDDAGSVVSGCIPGATHWYYIPVEAKP